MRVAEILNNPEVYTAAVEFCIFGLRELALHNELISLCMLAWRLHSFRRRLTDLIDRTEDNRRCRDQSLGSNYSNIDEAIEDLARGDQMLRDNGLDAIVDSISLPAGEVVTAVSNLIC